MYLPYLSPVAFRFRKIFRAKYSNVFVNRSLSENKQFDHVIQVHRIFILACLSNPLLWQMKNEKLNIFPIKSFCRKT